MFLIPQCDSGDGVVAGHDANDPHMMLEVLRQDYIRTAWSKGLKERAVIVRHAIKNAHHPGGYLVGTQLPLLVGGSVIMENIFNLPGLVVSCWMRSVREDYPMVSRINLFFGVVVIGANLVIDLVYHYLDPRVRYD